MQVKLCDPSLTLANLIAHIINVLLTYFTFLAYFITSIITVILSTYLFYRHLFIIHYISREE